MADPPQQGEPRHPDDVVEPVGGSGTAAGDARPENRGARRRRPRRRAVRPGTNPSAEEAPDVVAPRDEPEAGEAQHDRWLREQRPPHWE